MNFVLSNPWKSMHNILKLLIPYHNQFELTFERVKMVQYAAIMTNVIHFISLLEAYSRASSTLKWLSASKNSCSAPFDMFISLALYSIYVALPKQKIFTGAT